MRRNTAGVVASLFALLALVLIPSSSLAAGPALPANPTGLTMLLAASNKSISGGGWINQSQLTMRFRLHVTSSPVAPQVEIQPSDVPFTGTPNFTSAPVTTSGVASVHVTGLLDGHTYHWQARAQDQAGNDSAWVPFGAGATTTDLGIDRSTPTRPAITSPTNPNQHRPYNVHAVELHWASQDTISGVQGYRVVLQHHAHVIKKGPSSAHTGVKVSNLADGIWFMAVRAVDHAGNWSPTATYRFVLDRTAPKVTWLSPRRMAFNPYIGPISVRFKVDQPANGNLSLYRVGSKQPTANFKFASLAPDAVKTITWSGKGPKGKPVPAGYYFFSATFSDRADNITRANLGGIAVHPEQAVKSATGQLLYPSGGKIIIVSLSRQTLYAYDGTKLVQQTYVTTGNPALPTPLGSYNIIAKYSPFEFISPWPEGSPYYYAPSWSNYAMLFQGSGYFLHDAPWRSAFGPGTNGAGQPGTNYGGTHGCVNIPPAPMVFLYGWAVVGTPVDIVP